MEATTSAKVIIAAIINSVQGLENGELEIYLEDLPVEDMDDDTGKEYLRQFLEVAEEVGNSEAVEIILRRWDRDLDTEDDTTVPTYVNIFSYLDFADGTLLFVMTSMKDLTVAEILEITAKKVHSPEAPIITSRIIRLFPQWITFESLSKIKDTSDEFNNFRMSEYLEERLRKYGPVSIVPDYIIVGNEEKGDIPEFVERKGWTREELVKIAKESIAEEDLTDEEKEIKLEQYRIGVQSFSQEELDNEGNKFLLAEFRKSLRFHPELCRRYGPANPITALDLSDPDDAETEFGGCRMLLCKHFHDKEDEDDIDAEESITPDWFIGVCLECGREITKRNFAVRRPLLQGGWWGCFCSWSCVTKRVMKDPDGDTTTLSLIDTYSKEIDKNGIYLDFLEPN